MGAFSYTTFDSESTIGYKQITTFFSDFGIAEHFGESAIQDTYKSSREYADTDYKVLTELAMVLNWKVWEHYQKNQKLAEIYNKLWDKTDRYAKNNLKGEALTYYLDTTD